MSAGFWGVVVAWMVSLSMAKLVDVDSDEDTLVSDLASQLSQTTAERLAIKRHQEWQPQQQEDQRRDSEKKTEPVALESQSEQKRKESEPGQTQEQHDDVELADKVAQEMERLLQEEEQQQQESQAPVKDQIAEILNNPVLARTEEDFKLQLQPMTTEVEQQRKQHQESSKASLVDTASVGSAAGDTPASPAAAATTAPPVAAAGAPDTASDDASLASADAAAPVVDAVVSAAAADTVAPVAAAGVEEPIAAAHATAPVATSDAAAPVATSDETVGGSAATSAAASAAALSEQPPKPEPQQPESLAEDGWTYEDVDGWSTIGMCGHSGDQSPIDIRRESVNYYNNLTELSYIFQPLTDGAAAELDTEPYTWKISYAPTQGVVFVDGKDFELQSVHVHSPSENTINGQHFPMEAHMVHQAIDGQLLVVSQMLGVGELENPYFSNVWDKFPNATGKGPTVPAANPYALLLPLDKSYFRWLGSTTTPPCVNNTIWMMMQRPVMIGRRELDVYRAKVNLIPGNKLAPKERIPGLEASNFSMDLGTNNRPTKPLAGRVVQGFSKFMVQTCTNIPSSEMVAAGQNCSTLEKEVRLLRSRAANISRWRLSPGAFAAEEELSSKLATFIQNHTAVCTLPSNPFLFEWMGHKYCQRSCYSLGLGYTSDKCTPEQPTDVSSCTNEVAPQMLTTCENADLFNLCATLRESYRLKLSSKKYCQQSCYDNGNGYPNDVC